MDDQAGMSCRICSSTKVVLHDRHGRYQIFRCIDCDVRFAHPFKQMERGQYEDEFYIYQTNQFLTAIDPYAAVGWILRRLFGVLPTLMKPEGKTLLDVGCGSGLLVHLAEKAGFDAYGIDFNQKSIQAGMEHLHLAGRLYAADLSQLKAILRDRKFDVVTVLEVLEHIENPGNVLRDIHDMLPESGLLAVSVPNGDRFRPKADDSDCPPHHLTFWTKKAIRRLLVANGFTPVFHDWEGFTLGLGITKTFNNKVLGNPNLSPETKLKIYKSCGSLMRVLKSLIGGRDRFVSYVSKRIGLEGRCQLIMATKTLRPGGTE